MRRCRACSRESPEDSRFCPGCGAALEVAAALPTQTSAPSVTVEPRAAPARRLTTDPGGYGRFLPGTRVAERYRIMGLLGRGGMGEVYRADDLKLGQAVALKFLPASVEADDARLQRFLNEVKVARQISHPGVCRVYDVGEVDGHHFISMEYVDGEDLASLLRRIGRLPKDKAVQIARQLCAGLAAAHDQGILHRDIKPANVMIDGRGRAKIADFGLAGLAEEIRGLELTAGTPAYMAPEQRTGKGVSIRSDLYSLGLVLYEVFTGQPAFCAPTPAEMARLQEESTPTHPTALVEGFDPVVERILLRCLEKDPADRPASALTIAAALPGGDPLAAALAAGETPSPEMVAAAPRVGSLRPAVAAACLAGVLLGLIGVVLVSGTTSLHRRVPLEKPPEVLADRAREIAKDLGYTDPPADSAYGFSVRGDYIRWVRENDPSPGMWNLLDKEQPPTIYFWYRQSPRLLVPVRGENVTVGSGDPPLDVSGMVNLETDTRGHLVLLEAIPPQVDEPGAFPGVSAPDWQVLFGVAGLDPARFTPTEPRWLPVGNSDARVAWEGSFPDRPEIPIRLEAAAYRGRITYFEVVGPWNRPARMQAHEPKLADKVGGMILLSLFVLGLIAGALIARRNLRLGRGDRKGAFRLAAVNFTAFMIGWVFLASHVPDVIDEFGIFVMGVEQALFLSGLFWLAYISLEPYARRWWPSRIISWSRLLAGSYRDPLVGRDLLIGGFLGMVFHWSGILLFLLRTWIGLPEAGRVTDLDMLLGIRIVAGAFLYEHLTFAVFLGVACLFLLLLFRLILRRDWLATGTFWIIMALFLGLGGNTPITPTLGFAMAAWGATVVTFTLVRFGLLALISAWFFHFLCGLYPYTSDFSSWYAGSSIAGLFLGLVVASFSFHTSLGERSFFNGGVLRD